MKQELPHHVTLIDKPRASKTKTLGFIRRKLNALQPFGVLLVAHSLGTHAPSRNWYTSHDTGKFSVRTLQDFTAVYRLI